MYVCNRSLSRFLNQHHGPRVQARAIYFIANEIEKIEASRVGTELEGSPVALDPIYSQCREQVVRDIGQTQIRAWWKEYENSGELPYVMKKRRSELKRLAGHNLRGRVLTDEEVLILKGLVDKHPQFYLDEFAFELGKLTGKYLSTVTIYDYLRTDLNMSLKKLSAIAQQRCYEQECEYMVTISLMLGGDAKRMITIDETHKDRNAARRRKGWKKKHAGNETAEWFRNCIRYTLIAAANYRGFVKSACDIVFRDEISDEGAAGTVNSDYFLNWVKTHLVPVLGNFERGEPNSIVLMDNASTHMNDEVVKAIRDAGAEIVYLPPFSPHLNPIEKMFSVYKAYLKKHYQRMNYDWEAVHWEALKSVNRDMGIGFFRHCKVPGSHKLLTSTESDQLIQAYNACLILCILIIKYNKYN